MMLPLNLWKALLEIYLYEEDPKHTSSYTCEARNKLIEMGLVTMFQYLYGGYERNRAGGYILPG